MYEGKVKSSQPSLCETRDKQPLCHCHTISVIKVFLSLSMVYGHRWQHTGKVNVLGLAYNQHETWDKRPLNRDPDRSWCHRPTSVKLSWSQSIDPRTERQHTHLTEVSRWEELIKGYGQDHRVWSDAHAYFLVSVRHLHTMINIYMPMV